MRAGPFTTLAPALLMACALASPQAARATDYLRGSQIGDPSSSPSGSTGATDWSGFYAGGFAGYSNVNFDSSKTPGSLIANHLRQTTIENEMHVSSMLSIPSRSTSKGTFGGFAGYNVVWDDIVLGIEVDYTRIGSSSTGYDSIARSYNLSDVYLASAWVSGRTSAKLEQVGTVRGRIGYTMGNIMPFVTAGLAYGTGKVSHSATVKVRQEDPDPGTAPVLPLIDPPQATLSGGRSNATMFGGVVGGGVEALFGSVLVRGEVLYARLGGQSKSSVDYTTARIGAGIKF